LYDLKSLIEVGDYPNCRTLAQKLEISPKTIQRDITYMRDQMGVPVVYHPQRFGFYFDGPVTLSDPLDVSEGELAAILIAQKALQQYRGTVFEQPLRSACQKIEQALRGRVSVNLEDLDEAFSFRDTGTTDIQPDVFDKVGQAVRESRELRFRYQKLGAPGYERRWVRPYHLGCVNNQWYLFSYDVRRKQMRTFALVRLREPLVQPQQFERPEEFSVASYLSHSLNVFRGAGEPEEVRVEFDAWAAGLVRNRQWHQSQKIRELKGGAVEVELQLSGFEEVERWVLGFGAHARVTHPPAFVERMQKTTAELAGRYTTKA